MQKAISTRVRRPRRTRPMMRGSKRDWSLVQEKPGRKMGLLGIPAAVDGIKVGGRKKEMMEGG
ncbi:hypothetical protein I79_002744 [Cricetulus griseus]|uniref:Uncharacterized protein n=1 Tax=Cricetulus griseus TaxID=10029 RepID=G3GY74_CRIGR|nr:hypothetical protein I79_002744 [Cricetulus griseus]